MLFRLLKKVTRNYGVFLALFLGIILSLVTINSTVMYGNSLKDSLFQKVLKEYESKYDETAGAIHLYKDGIRLRGEEFEEFQEENKSVLSMLGLDIEEGRTEIEAKYSLFWYEESNIEEGIPYYRNYRFKSIFNFIDHVNIVQGRAFNDTFKHKDKNVIEVMIDRRTMRELRLEMDKLYRTELVREYNTKVINAKLESEKEMNPTYFKVVGVYEPKKNDLFWRKGILRNNYNAFIAHENSLDAFCMREGKLVDVNSEYFIDFSQYKYSDFGNFKENLEVVRRKYESDHFEFNFNMKSLFEGDNKNFKLVSNMLWIIQIPVLAILFLYILMITGIIIDRDKDEIALLKSRGATRGKILANYLFDGGIILAVGLIITPLLSISAAKWMSTTSGFMEFNGEASKNIYMSFDNIYYSIGTGLVFLSALLIPVVKATKEGVVDRKKSKVRIKLSTWKKTFIDFILIGVGFYGLRSFMNSQTSIQSLKVNINSMSIDPLIFISATVLAFGFSLFFLRIYPFFIKLILKLFNKIMPAHIFVLFSNLCRKAGKREYTMLFIMILISSSIFNLKIARTINTNVIDNIKYTSGAEVRMIGYWKGDGFNAPTGGGDDFTPDVLMKTELIEPDYGQFESLESLDSITKVLKINNVSLFHSALEINKANIVAVQPKEFGETAHMREDLTPIHWNNYLNVLAKQPNVVFLSSNIKLNRKNKMKIGDLIEIEVFDFRENFIFGGYVDYWPGSEEKDENLIIGNFNYFYRRIARVPYEVWGKLEDNKKEEDLLNEIREKSVGIMKFSSISELTKENIFLKAVNSSITVAFILSMIVTLLGFLIYWCICIRERELQFGILRSLGVKLSKIYSMIFVEQFLVTGMSLLVGVGIGQFISEKFLKIVTEIIFGDSLILPIVQYITSSDYLLIVAIFIISVIFVLVIILKYIADIKLNQAIKIGED